MSLHADDWMGWYMPAGCSEEDSQWQDDQTDEEYYDSLDRLDGMFNDREMGDS